MRKRLAAALLMAAAGCAPAQAPGNASAACDASRAQSLIGQPATSQLAARAKQLSGAGVVRWLQPGQIVTMEYQADRLSIQLDDQNRVEAIRCG